MESSGQLIVIEGVDGAGKSTQYHLLRQRLEKQGHDVVRAEFPRHTEPSAYFVRKYLRGKYGKLEDVSPYSVALFYALDRYDGSATIRQALDEGKIVLADRYTGSGMAYQGAGFDNTEERRGFFIWLDNLEFELLKIPRPNKSFVLRVPLDAAEKLLQETGKELDIFETNQAHMRKIAGVFDDLVQLFPKDFSRVDCVRGGKLLSIDQVHELLWQAVEPLLPPKPKVTKHKRADLRVAKKRTVAAEVPPETTHEPSISVPVGGVSELLAHQLSLHPSLSYLSHEQAEVVRTKGEYPYYIPSGLDALTAGKYHAAMDKFFDTHTTLLPQLTQYLAHKGNSDAEQTARQLLQPLLPLATKTTLTLYAQRSDIPEITDFLRSHENEEARQMSASLAQHLKQPSSTDTSAQRTARFRAQAATHLQSSHGTSPEPLRLVDRWPRNELDILPTMLFEASNLSLAELQQQVATWPISLKAEVFNSYLSSPATAALEQVRYTWEMLESYAVFQKLLRSGAVDSMEAQTITPRYGYASPPIIEAAGLDEAYATCFDLSAQLYSILQEAGHTDKAPYAALFGHRLRFALMHTAADSGDLGKSLAGTDLKPAFIEQLTEVHPLLAQTISS